MKKIVLWSGIGLGVFVALVGIIFVILTYLSPDPEPAQRAAETKPEQEVIQQLPSDVTEQVSTQVAAQLTNTDSLEAVLGDVRSDLLFTKLRADSLQQRIIFIDGLVVEYEKTIANLNDQVLAKQVQSSRIKDLAKTYETMKPVEIKPILANVNDETVIALYENMSSRTRKVILNSLPGNRAAVITQQLAGFMTENDQ